MADITLLPAAPAFLANAVPTGNQSAPTVAALAGGNFVIGWTDGSGRFSGPSTNAIAAQIFGPTGVMSGGEFAVTSAKPVYKALARFAPLDNGGFAAIWNDGSATEGNAGSILRAQALDASGQKVGLAFTVSNSTYHAGDVATISGGFVVGWSNLSGFVSSTIDAQRFTDDGLPVGTATAVGQPGATTPPDFGSLASLTDGGFGISWSQRYSGGHTESYDNHVASYSAGGNLIFDTTSVGIGPVIAALANDRLLVLTSRSGAIYARTLNSDGSVAGGDTQVTANGYLPRAVGLGNGDYVVAWEVLNPYGTPIAAHAQLFDPSGGKLGADLLENSPSIPARSTPDLAVLTDGSVVLTWAEMSSSAADTDQGSIHAQVLTPLAVAGTVSGLTNGPSVVDHVVSASFGSAGANREVTVYDRAALVGSTVSDASGAWSLPFAFAGYGPVKDYALTATTTLDGQRVAAQSVPLLIDSTANKGSFGTVTHNAESVFTLYDGILGRTGDSLGLEYWNGRLLDGASQLDVAAGLLASPEFQAGYGGSAQGRTNDEFVRYMYQEALNRPVDSVGESYWNDQLAKGASRADVALKIALSQENRSQLDGVYQAGVFIADRADSSVSHLYYGILGRAPDPSGLTAFSGALRGGGSVTAVAQQFLSSPEYAGRHPTQPDDQTFVGELYRDALGRDASGDAGAAYWTRSLSSGGLTRADVAAGIADSNEARIHLVGLIQEGWHIHS